MNTHAHHPEPNHILNAPIELGTRTRTVLARTIMALLALAIAIAGVVLAAVSIPAVAVLLGFALVAAIVGALVAFPFVVTEAFGADR